MSFFKDDIVGSTGLNKTSTQIGSVPLSVSELTQKLKRVVEPPFSDVFVQGEVSNLTVRTSGHCYFQLKDENSSIACVIFCERGPGPSVAPPQDGDKIEVRGSLGVYVPKGQIQIRVRSVSRAGLGALFAAFQRLKEKLAAEGLFDADRKRPVPSHPRVVAVVTSKDGAALRDILKVIERRAPHLEVHIAHARVQGDGAAIEVAAAISRVNQMATADVIIVGRGGGAIEDLWAFNEETVIRAIADSQIPVISSVGHETDTTLADFVSDLRAPTPSAAAEMICGDSLVLRRQLQQIEARIRRAIETSLLPLNEVIHLKRRMHTAMIPRIGGLRAVLKQWDRSYAVQQPLTRTLNLRQRLDDLAERCIEDHERRARTFKQNLRRIDAQLRALNPHAVLKRGYSISFDAETRKAIRSASDTFPGQALRIVLGNGQIDALVSAGVPRLVHRTTKRKAKSKSVHPVEWFGLPSDQDAGPGK